ncbi:MAG: protein kinase [Deltaproteobacteria bacterium]|nr:protein kinase [Deltaproteobacteria bacterium]
MEDPKGQRDDAVTVAREDKTLAMARTISSSPHAIGDPDADVVVLPTARRYEPLGDLGEGGMGEVRLCKDRMIGREVAFKAVLGAHAGKENIRARFIREARVQGQLEHPAIVPVYDFGADANGTPYFTMKRVRGTTLDGICEELRAGDEEASRTYSLHKLLAAFVQVCLAIDFAHERGVLHRDLKPSNVMLGGYGEVYVLDWGLAKVRTASKTLDDHAPQGAPAMGGEVDVEMGPNVTPPTEAGAVLGTPGYMAPEQVRGEEVDERTDVYALGAILFELLTLEPLHGAGNVAAMMKSALKGADARPSVRAPHRPVAPELEAICVKACARDREGRYASARELADATEAYLSGDRDLALRKTLASVHLDRARDAAAGALAPGAPLGTRQDALREIGHALALDPGNPAGLELLVRMLTEAPRETPAEVVEAVEAARMEAQRKMLPRIAVIYLVSWLVFLPAQYLAGVLDWRLILAPLGAWSIAALVIFLTWRFFSGNQHAMIRVAIVTGALAMATSSVTFTPLILLPEMVVMSVMASLLMAKEDRRWLIVACNWLALFLPLALVWARLHPTTFDVADNTLMLHVAAFGVTRTSAILILSFSYAALILIAGRFGWLYRQALQNAETKSQLHAWQLRQLVPIDAPPLPATAQQKTAARAA